MVYKLNPSPSDQERRLMEVWDKQYPMGEREKEYRDFAKEQGFEF